MKCNKNNTDNSKEIFVDIKPISHVEKSNNLYQSDNLVKPQIRWFKGSRDRGFKSDIAA